MKVVLFNRNEKPNLIISMEAAQFIARNLSQRFEANRLVHDDIMKAIRNSKDGNSVDLGGCDYAHTMTFRSNPIFVSAIEKYDLERHYTVKNSSCEWYRIDGFFTENESLACPDLSEYVECDCMAKRNYGW